MLFWNKVLGAALLLVSVHPAHAASQETAPHLAMTPTEDARGGVYEVTIERSTTSATSDGSSSGSSSSNYALQMTVTPNGPDSTTVTFDLPADRTAKDRARQWQFPATIAYDANGGATLFQPEILDRRLDDWLTLGKWTREMCGRWIFTWNAFYIECDPQSVIENVQPFLLPPADLAEGAMHTDPNALAPAAFVRLPAEDDAIVLEAQFTLDPTKLEAERIEQDKVVAEIMGPPTSPEMAAVRQERNDARNSEEVTGTLRVQYDLTYQPDEWVRTEISTITVRRGDGVIETETAETVTSWTRTGPALQLSTP